MNLMPVNVLKSEMSIFLLFGKVLKEKRRLFVPLTFSQMHSIRLANIKSILS